MVSGRDAEPRVATETSDSSATASPAPTHGPSIAETTSLLQSTML